MLNGLIGPRGDAYAPDELVAADEAERYHLQQLEWLAETEVDMVTALTFTQADEAIGVVRAAGRVGLPIVASFTVETDGRLPTGQALGDGIASVDEATGAAAVYFMVNGAHPDHSADVIQDAGWARRTRGLRCLASKPRRVGRKRHPGFGRPGRTRSTVRRTAIGDALDETYSKAAAAPIFATSPRSPAP